MGSIRKKDIINKFKKMKVVLKTLFKKILPDSIIYRWKEYAYKQKLRKARKKVIEYLETLPENEMTDERRDVLKYLKFNTSSTLPHTFTKKYNRDDIIVYMDDRCNMRYVLQDNKRLYFKKNWDEQKIKTNYNVLLQEQDEDSPHKYETKDIMVCEGDIVIDAGVAEGNFALSVVEKAKKLYLFEIDDEWIEALKATFAPWKDKVIIVNKYIADNNNDNCITLDKYLGEERVNFIKADIEGAEKQLLLGADTLLSQDFIKLSLCTYHNPNDAEVLNKILKEKGFQTEFSKGYILSPWSLPYLRKGVIRAIKL
jgi:hypothetical protein